MRARRCGIFPGEQYDCKSLRCEAPVDRRTFHKILIEQSYKETTNLLIHKTISSRFHRDHLFILVSTDLLRKSTLKCQLELYVFFLISIGVIIISGWA